MRIRILRTIYYSGKQHYEAGAVADVPEATARPWLKVGAAMQDKSLDGATETKEAPAISKKKSRR